MLLETVTLNPYHLKEDLRLGKRPHENPKMKLIFDHAASY